MNSRFRGSYSIQYKELSVVLIEINGNIRITVTVHIPVNTETDKCASVAAGGNISCRQMDRIHFFCEYTAVKGDLIDSAFRIVADHIGAARCNITSPRSNVGKQIHRFMERHHIIQETDCCPGGTVRRIHHQ